MKVGGPTTKKEVSINKFAWVKKVVANLDGHLANAQCLLKKINKVGGKSMKELPEAKK